MESIHQLMRMLQDQDIHYVYSDEKRGLIGRTFMTAVWRMRFWPIVPRIALSIIVIGFFRERCIIVRMSMRAFSCEKCLWLKGNMWNSTRGSPQAQP